MTELQLAIGHLKETLSVGNVLLGKLEKEQRNKNLEILNKLPVFPYRFIAVKDTVYSNQFVIGLQEGGGILKKHEELPSDYLGRTCFDENDLRQIIKGLQTLVGDSQ